MRQRLSRSLEVTSKSHSLQVDVNIQVCFSVHRQFMQNMTQNSNLQCWKRKHTSAHTLLSGSAPHSCFRHCWQEQWSHTVHWLFTSLGTLTAFLVFFSFSFPLTWYLLWSGLTHNCWSDSPVLPKHYFVISCSHTLQFITLDIPVPGYSSSTLEGLFYYFP